ncbi:TetR/AcrR family transcriptional regulator [Pseudoduganella sp. RAF53_2]|uniref:TetR/AcrR family transcriptional regulator n=1 Tax=unclassified Pseudoduganella TaxID=2637179 RepID=UPI003F9998DF
MRYPPGHKEERRKELLKTSGEVIKNKGFSATGVDALMAAAGMTSGAFYSNFSSKNDLLKALVESELERTRGIYEANPHTSPEAWLEFEIDRYLSLSHAQRTESGCVIPAIGAEIARGDKEIKEVFEREQRKLVAILTEKLGSEALAWAFKAQLIGTIMMARAMPTEAAQQEVLDAGKKFLKAAVQSIRR